MRFIRNLKIDTIMYVMTVLIAIGFAGMGGYAMYSMSEIQKGAEKMHENSLESVKQLMEVRAGVYRSYSLTIEHILTDTSEQKAALQKDIEGYYQLIDESMRGSQALLESEEERSQFIKVQEDLVKTVNLQKQILAMSSSGYEQEQQAEALALNTLKPMIEGVIFQVRELYSRSVQTADAAAARNAEQYTLAQNVMKVQGVGAIINFLMLVLCSRLLVVRPIKRITSSMLALADGDLDTKIPATDLTNEVGQMASAVQVFKDNMVKNRELDEQAKRDNAAREKRAQELERLIREFETNVVEVVHQVTSASSQLQNNANELLGASEDASVKSRSMAAGAELSFSSVQAVAAAAEQLASSINEVTQQVSESTGIAQKAVDQVNSVNATVERLSQSAQKIGDVVNLINDIAAQTNLLALNATIEAARAGEAGKGFAVVASEVKGLASQTGRATEEIAQQVTDMQSITHDSVDMVKQIGEVIGEINNIVGLIAAAVEEQSAATKEIARNAQSVAGSTSEMSQDVQTISSAATQTNSMSSSVSATATQLGTQSKRLEDVVSNFINAVRVA